MVSPHRAEVHEPRTCREWHAAYFLLEEVILVEHENEWGVMEAWLPGANSRESALLTTLQFRTSKLHTVSTKYKIQLVTCGRTPGVL